MAIHLITGVPGAGKTLRAIWLANKLISGDDQDRPIFGNVRGYKRQALLPGSEMLGVSEEVLDSAQGEWMDCPNGSIIIIDEVQQRWRRARATGAPPPEIAALERHRHRNIDFIITCQNVSQLNNDVCALVDTHEHLNKKGKGVAAVYRWEGRCSLAPHRGKKEPDCEISVWKYPKWVFEEYNSAVEHNVKKKIPRVMKVGIAFAIIVPAMIAASVFTIKDKLFKPAVADDQVLSQSQSAAVRPASYTPDPEPEPLVETVTAYGGFIAGGHCQLIDQMGTRILVSQPDCLMAMDLGFPIEVDPLNLSM